MAPVPAHRVVGRHRRRVHRGRGDPARSLDRRLLGRAARRGGRGGAERGHPARARRAATAGHARPGLPARPVRRRRHPPPHRRPDRRRAPRRRLRVGATHGARGRRRERRARRPARHSRHVLDPPRAADRAPAGHHREDRRPGDHLPRDRRARAARAAAGDARRQRADDGSLAGGHAPAGRMGDRSLLADGRQPGGDPAGLERGHLRLPLGREGDRDDADVLRASRLRGDRAAACDRHRPARRRRLQPRQPALRRGGGRDPHRQPDGRREEVQPRLPGVPGQRRQRDAHARAVHLRGRARVDGVAAGDPARRAAARASRRDLSADARRRCASSCAT